MGRRFGHTHRSIYIPVMHSQHQCASSLRNVSYVMGHELPPSIHLDEKIRKPPRALGNFTVISHDGSAAPGEYNDCFAVDPNVEIVVLHGFKFAYSTLKFSQMLRLSEELS